MYIGEIISSYYAEVSLTDTVHEVLERINELHFRQLPIVEHDDFVGLVQEDDLLSTDSEEMMIRDIRRTSPFVYIYDYQHIYDALQMLAVYGHDIVVVVDKDHKYQGIVSQKTILEAINNSLVTSEQGAIIVLEMDSKDYSLSQVSHIIESENARILSFTTRQLPDADRLEMTIKVNKSNISAIVASLWRFDYVVKATFNDGSDDSDIQNRYNLLMNYLDI